MPKQEAPPPPPVRIHPLSNKWMAVVTEEGDILLQHRVGWIQGTGQEVDLSQIGHPEMALARRSLEQVGVNRLALRTLVLRPDGSILCDPHAVSPGGQPVDPYEIVGNALDGVASYFRKEQKKFEAELAAEVV